MTPRHDTFYRFMLLLMLGFIAGAVLSASLRTSSQLSSMAYKLDAIDQTVKLIHERQK